MIIIVPLLLILSYFNLVLLLFLLLLFFMLLWNVNFNIKLFTTTQQLILSGSLPNLHFIIITLFPVTLILHTLYLRIVNISFQTFHGLHHNLQHPNLCQIYAQYLKILTYNGNLCHCKLY